jgi:nonsense-mediated mRNA decay protein 3
LFCVECGREGELIGSLCEDCYSKRHVQPSLPDHVDVTLCAHCSSMETDKGWEDVGSVKEASELALRHALVLPKDSKISDIRVQLHEKDERNLDAKVSVLLTVHDHEFERELETIVRLKRGSCTECSKMQGNYYEAILQVRGPGRDLDESAQKDIENLVQKRVATMRKSSRGAFVSKIERVKGGLDFYFSTAPAARGLAKEIQESFCAEYKESSKLWGRRLGKEIYRMTFLVRLPGFSRGDIVEHQSREYFVRGMSRGMIRGFDLKTGEERSLKMKEAGDCTLIRTGAQILKAVVLAEKANELQVLDPETNTPVDVRKPVGFSRKGEQVRIVKTKLGTFALSDSW